MLKRKKSKNFELTVVTRDKEGIATGRKAFEHDSGYKIWEFWQQNKSKNKKKKPRNKLKKNVKLPNAEQAEKILKELYGVENESNER